MTERQMAPRTSGLVIHWAARYDFLAWLYLCSRTLASPLYEVDRSDCATCSSFWPSKRKPTDKSQAAGT
jgi:hypothetical protein